MVMLIVQRTLLLVYLFILKRAKPFLSSSIFFNLLFILNRLAYIWTLLYFKLQGWTIVMNSLARFKSIWTVQYFQLQSWTVFMNRAGQVKSIWTVPYLQLRGWTSLYNFEPHKLAFFNRFLVVENQTCFFEEKKKFMIAGRSWSDPNPSQSEKC